MSDLIARLEAASEGSRELDAEIAKAIGEIPTYTVGVPFVRYTTSLDAALSLVPDDAGIQINRYWIASRDGGVWSVQISRGLSGHRFGSEDAPTAALSLCIAALKARARAPVPGSAAP